MRLRYNRKPPSQVHLEDGMTTCYGYLYSFDRMDFQCMGKMANAGRFERGCLKVTTENLTNWDLPGCEKPPNPNE